MGVEPGGAVTGTPARTTAPPPPYRPRRPTHPAARPVAGGQACGGLAGGVLPRGVHRVAALLWLAVVGVLLAREEFHAAIVMLAGFVVSSRMLRVTGPTGRQRVRQRVVTPRPKAPAVRTPVPQVPAAELRLSEALARAEAAADRIEPASLDLVRDVGQLLGPLLTGLRTRTVHPQLRHDLETIASEHLPRTLADYLVLPDDYAREHVTPAGTTPAQELRAQLELLAEGCRRLREAVLSDDVDRQQQQTRFLESKFRRGELDL